MSTVPQPIRTLSDFAPPGVERGVGLALQTDDGRYLFFLAGARHRCPPGECFYAGIGGHVERGEDWLACARREAWEEIHAEVDILPAETTWHIPRDGTAQPLQLDGVPPPLALYEMIHPPHTPRAGHRYRIVIFRAKLRGIPGPFPPDEVRGLLALTRQQVVRGAERRPTLAQLLAEGATLIADGTTISSQTRLYPIGTAMALAHIFRHPAVKLDF
ncbi:MAG: NUDIX domain-containing protein [Caldilineae bacterium]|nr:MAG: NUDIX domain-containing protein [Caldilineae bacterium]